ncbi:MAG: PQQ-binding-like beta-propeller repeat protein [Brumimicrobium sp.]|nr:PQQ-binding-like beta-propeller repeat protein [Brumimicrobium sp.]
MKQKILATVFLFFQFTIFGQNVFPLAWEAKFPIKIDSWRISEDRQFIFGYNDKEGSVISGADGSILWSGTFENIIGLKKIDFKYWVPESEVIALYTNERNTKVCKKYFLDVKTGKLLWQTEEGGTSNDFIISLEHAQNTPGMISLKEGSTYKKMDIRTGKLNSEYQAQTTVIKKGKKEMNHTSFRNDEVSIELIYERSKDVGFMSSKKPKPIKITCYDLKKKSMRWEQEISGFYTHSLCNTGIFESTSADLFGGDHIWLRVEGDRVLVIYEGMSVLDLGTGKLLWSTELKLSDIDFKMVALDQQIGVASLPVTDLKNRRVYAVDLVTDKAIKCFDLDNGKVIWKSGSFSKESVVPGIELENDILIVKTGGTIVTQRYVAGTNGNPDVCTKNLKETSNNGIIALNAATGATLWTSEEKAKEWDDKFKSAISDILIRDGKLYVSSGDQVMKIDPSSGKLEASMKLKGLKIGSLRNIKEFEQHLYVKGSEGIAKLSMKNLETIWSSNTGDYLTDFQIGNSFFIVTKKDKTTGNMEEFVRVDLENGNLLGKIKDCPFPYFTEDGEFFFQKDKNEIMKYRTKA